VFISVITELELLSFKGLDDLADAELRQSLKSCFVVDLENPIREKAIALRKKHHLKLPDALIAATAIHLQLPLISADKDFTDIEELMFILYKFN